MKKAAVWAFIGLVTLLAGCGSPLAAGGAGFAGGLAAAKTLEGMQADLAAREQALIARYNELVEAGAKAEDLEDLRRDIETTVQLRQGAETGKTLLGVDWNDPAAAGGAIGLIGTLAWTWLSKRKLSQKYVSMKAGQARLKEKNPTMEAELYAMIGTERAARGL